MPKRVTIYVPVDAVPEGSVALVHGPGSDGNVDSGSTVPGGVRTVAGRPSNAIPEAFGPAGQEERPVRAKSAPMVYGAKQFAATLLQRDSGAAAAGTLETVAVFVSATPVAPKRVTAVEQLVSGRMKFGFEGGQVT